MTESGGRSRTPRPGIMEAFDEVGAASEAAVRAVQYHGLASLLRGRRTSADRIASESHLPIGQVEAAVAQLRANGRIELDDDGIAGVAGLTLHPTGHRLDLPTASMHTWCALDAIGIPAALAIDATLTTACPYCKRQLVVAITRGEPPADERLRLFLPTQPCDNVRAQFCPSTNLFCGSRHLRRWAAENPSIVGDELDLDATARLGRQLWKDRTTEHIGSGP